MDHSPGFLAYVNEAKPRIREITIDEARSRLAKNTMATLVDVREDSEWQRSHASQAKHLGKGVLERDIEKLFPDKDAELLMYCGGGYRSILTADVAQKMGYKNVFSIMGGFRGLSEAGWPMKSGD